MFRRLVAGLWTGFLILWWTWALFNKKSDRTTRWRGKSWAMRLGMVAAIALTVSLERMWSPAGWLAVHDSLFLQPIRAWRYGGVALCLAGFALAIWARLYLGGNWGMPMSLRQGHELITSGPYARVRHPIYSGLLLAGLGSILALGALWLPVFVLVGAFFVISARTEEKMLNEQFPQAYPPYRQRTKMLIPFVF